jgi:hypothetical protein
MKDGKATFGKIIPNMRSNYQRGARSYDPYTGAFGGEKGHHS